ncbi:hypothetical protein Q9L58_006140 [Maublancomyces gigas]|uniref:Uncharacterized protein n=1 Tax=Discina gigas TaxID=1032678 RepID=A0ABR3GHB8_9PEZI
MGITQQRLISSGHRYSLIDTDLDQMSTAHDQAVRAYNHVSFLTYNEEAPRTRRPKPGWKTRSPTRLGHLPLPTVTMRSAVNSRPSSKSLATALSGQEISSLRSLTTHSGGSTEIPSKSPGYDSGYEEE